MRKHKEYLKYYHAFINLYGVISLKKAYDMLFDFEVSFSMEDMKKDIELRNKKDDGILFIPYRDTYLIANAVFASRKDKFEMMYDILKCQNNQPLYHPASLNTLLKYRDDTYIEKGIFYPQMIKFLRQYTPVDSGLTPELAAINLDFMSKVSCSYDDVKKLFYDAAGFPQDKKISKRFKGTFFFFDSNRRKWKNGGWSDFELDLLRSISSNNVNVEIKGELKDRILNGEIDPDELISNIKSVDVPGLIKQPLIEQIEDIKKLLDKNVA